MTGALLKSTSCLQDENEIKEIASMIKNFILMAIGF
jgi:hypothetical protein